MHPLRTYIHRFVPLTDAEWAPLAAALAPRHLARKQYFVREQESCHDIALLLSGACRLFYTHPDGEEKTTYFFFENHLMASYTSCLTNQVSPLAIQALVATELVVFPYAVLRGLYDEWPVYERFGRLVAEYHLIGTDLRLTEFLTQRPEERYRALLRSHKTKILERVPQHYIASYLGVTPVSLSRIRARVAEEDSRFS
ncbi:MAG TPA: Crp/Fnr family transcriptional regulator [Hymenobacter sp.]|nr:Crp/Fnr family transcriptional regulator [Hymenobacter sp.]